MTIRTKNKTERDKSWVTGERMKTKKIPRKVETMQRKADIPKYQKKILPASRGRIDKDIPIT